MNCAINACKAISFFLSLVGLWAILIGDLALGVIFVTMSLIALWAVRLERNLFIAEHPVMNKEMAGALPLPRANRTPTIVFSSGQNDEEAIVGLLSGTDQAVLIGMTEACGVIYTVLLPNTATKLLTEADFP